MTSISPGDGAMTTDIITNVTGWSSLLGLSTWGPSLGLREDALDEQWEVGSNVKRTFSWTEPNPCQ